MSTPCIILAGGLGTRLRSAVPDRPKCLAPVGKRSFLEIQLELLARQGIRDFVLSLGYLSEQVVAEVHRLSDRHALRWTVEPSALGTGGAIAFAMSEFGLTEALVTNGDTFLGGDLSSLLLPLQPSTGELARMAVIDVEDRARYGGVQLDQDEVTGFIEKGVAGPGLINAGLYRLSAEAFSLGQLLPQAFSLESMIFPKLVGARALRAARIKGAFTDIGVPEDYRRFCEDHG